MQAIVEFPYITGWRTPSEILPLEWRQVEMKAEEDRFDAGTTKNGEGRVFPFTTALRRILDDQQHVANTITRETNTIVRYVFCYIKGQKAGKGIADSGFNRPGERLASTPAARADPTRLSSHRRAKPRAGCRPGTRRHAAHRP